MSQELYTGEVTCVGTHLTLMPAHSLVVTAMDRGTPPLMGSATLTVVVMDVNDNSPTIPVPWEIRVPESECRSTEGQNWGTVGTMGGGGAHREARPVPARGWVTLAR